MESSAQCHGAHEVSRQAAVQALGEAQGAEGQAELRGRVLAQSKLGVEGRKEGIRIHLPNGRTGLSTQGVICSHRGFPDI